MKIERGHWIIAGVTGVIIAYLFLYAPVSAWMGERAQARAQAAQAATEAQEAASDEGVADVTTAGSISTGTILKREGVAVAELWALKKIGAKASEVVHFTSHDSEFRFREFLQGLREQETFQLLGHELPSQTALWIDDFNDPQHRLYTVETPDGETYEFCGWVRRIKTHPPLEGALVFEADVQCTHGPLTREVEEWKYYHCTEAPPAPGTPPPDDPGHWEEVDPPGELEDGEAVFGNAAANASVFGMEDNMLVGSRYPILYGESTENGSWLAGNWPSWPSTLTKSHHLPSGQASIYATYNPSTMIVSSAYAYLTLSPGEIAYNEVMIGLYDAFGDLLAASDVVTVNNTTPAWIEFPFTASAAVENECYLLAWQRIGSGGSAVLIGVGIYEAPDGHQWDPDDDYEYCQTVAVVTTTEETYCP